MDRYKKLVSNTFVFAIGTFSSKLLVFLMLPLYTRVLSNAEYGKVDLIVQTCNILIPIASLGIVNAVIRFGLENVDNKKSIFSVGLATILLGSMSLFVFKPVLQKIDFISGYILYIYFFVLASSLHSLCLNFVRSLEYVKLYAFDGVFRTISTVILNIVFLIIYQYGITGYLLAIIISDLISSIMLFLIAKLYKFISFKNIDKSTLTNMIKYSLPLIPATLSIWIINMSDRYILSYILGNEANGLYAIAYKVPTIIVIIVGIFMDAWQISAVNEHSTQDASNFFTKVLNVYSSLVFCGASIIITFTKPIMNILVSADFYSSWIYVPVLVLSTVFTCFTTFISSVYMIKKKSKQVLITTVMSAIINIVLNLTLIPIYGIQGAGIATLLSYIFMFVIRAVDTRRFIKIIWNIPKLIINISIIAVQSMILLYGINNWFIYEIIFVFLVLVINIKDLLAGAKRAIT